MFFIYSTVKAEEVLIPDSSIRLRVVANSNSIYDQSMKKQVKDYIEDEVYELLKDVDRIEDARKIISDNLDNINSDIESIFVDNNYDMDYKVDFGYNYFFWSLYIEALVIPMLYFVLVYFSNEEYRYDRR